MTLHQSDKNLSFLFRIVLITLFISGVLSISSCKKADRPTGPKEKVTIGVSNQVLSAPLIIAAEKGYFGDEGLDITIKNYSFGKLCLEAMFAKEVDLATVAEIPIVLNAFKRNDFSIIAEFAYNYDNSKIVVHKDRIRTGAELKGHNIGVPFGTSAQFFLDIYLNYSNVPKASVKLINISAQDLPAAMKNGTVDAISSFEPYAYETLQLLQDRAMRLEKIDLFKETFTLVGMKGFIENHLEALKKVLRSIDRANAFIQKNKKESIMILADKLKVDDKFIETGWDEYVFDLFLDQSLLVAMEDQARWAIANKLTDKTQIPNYLEYVDPDAMKAVKPGTATIME